MLETGPYKGVRDFYPEDQSVQKFIFETWRRVAEQFGYVEYNASVLEPAELYEGKTSEEIVNEQTYTFTDRGDRRVTLRPEMTPTVARMVAGKRRELAFPLRWYSIPNVFRYERPQRGRLREHWQLNCDIFGVSELQAEVEIITLAHSIMKAFGATESDFSIRVSSRHALPKDIVPETIRKIDRGESVDVSIEETDDIRQLIAALQARGIRNVVFDPKIVRGFDYYTGIVFEVFDTDSENNRSLFGGGRYDNLLALFGDEPMPTVGFGMGDVTMRNFLESRNLLPPYQSTTTLFVGTLAPEFIDAAETLASELRTHGLNVEVNVSDKKVGDQIHLADKKNIPYVLCIGAKEAETGTYVLKELRSGTETTVNTPDLIAFLKDHA